MAWYRPSFLGAKVSKKGAFEWIGEHPEVIPDILKGGNWLDADRVRDTDLRLMIANCSDDSEREKNYFAR